MPIIPTEFLNMWLKKYTPTPDIPIPDMDEVQIIKEELKFSNDLDNLQIRLVPRKCINIDVEFSPY